MGKVCETYREEQRIKNKCLEAKIVMADIKEVILATTDKWFLSEPLLFAVYCGHQLVENKKMKCSMRSGHRKIEYNPDILLKLGDIHIAELLRREVIRIILKHPYERQPINPVQEILYLASNVTIFQNKGTYVSPCLPAGVELPDGRSFEEYYNLLLHELSQKSAADSESDDFPFGSTQVESDDDNDNLEKGKEGGKNSEDAEVKTEENENAWPEESAESTFQSVESNLQSLGVTINDDIIINNGTEAAESSKNDKRRSSEHNDSRIEGGAERNTSEFIGSIRRRSNIDRDNSENEAGDEKTVVNKGSVSSEEIDSNTGQHAESKSQASKSNLNGVVKNDNGTDATELWEEDEVQIEYINRCIEDAMLNRQWGTLGGNIQEVIKASTIRAENVRRKMDMFRTSIISTTRRLTRMRPSRRYGWTQMGVIHPYTSHLLIAVDTSASVNSDDLIRFFGIINSFFTYGIPYIDVLQFDAEVYLPLLSLKRVTERIELKGRGGTNFQPPVDYFTEHKEYDGMIVFTDGYAPVPQMPPNRKILWVLKNIYCYNDCVLTPKIYI